jgi:hypothetical protein
MLRDVQHGFAQSAADFDDRYLRELTNLFAASLLDTSFLKFTFYFLIAAAVDAAAPRCINVVGQEVINRH